jgi:hypothetical protein
VRVSPDSIGILDLHKPLAELRHVCPSARDTTFAGDESTKPGVVFHLGAVTVLALQQFGGLSMDSTAPPDMWAVSGPGVSLPRHLSLSSRWRDLRAALGVGIGRLWLTRVEVEFCSLPRFRFDMRVDLPDSMASGIERDLSFIPDDAQLARVWVYSGEDVSSLCVDPPRE